MGLRNIGLKAAALCLLLSASAFGQSEVLVNFQSRCPASTMPLVVVANVTATSAAAGTGQLVCAQLDAGAFFIDMTTQPPTLRFKLVPVPPVPASPNFADAETPGGTLDGTNAIFTLLHAPSPAASLELKRNGLVLMQGLDYTLTGLTMTFLANLPNGSAVPQVGDVLQASYRYSN